VSYSLLALSRRKLFLIGSVAAIAAGLCSTSISSGASPLSHHAMRRASTSPWNYERVDYPVGTSTEVTGINNLSGSNGPEIVGYYVSSATGSTNRTFFYSSFYASGPYTATKLPNANFVDASYPNIKRSKTGNLNGTQLNAITTQPIATGPPVLAGEVADPGGQGGNWSVVYNQGLWSLVKNPDTLGGSDDVAFYGINNSDIAVGYYTNHGFPKIAYYVAPPEISQNIAFPPTTIPNPTSSIAYGINDSGDMVGTAKLSTGTVSWYALCKNSSCPTKTGSTSGSGFNPNLYCWGVLKNSSSSSFSTTAYAINNGPDNGSTNTREVAGSYTDRYGVTHGFLVTVSRTQTSVCGGGTSFTNIDEPYANGVTVVRGVNDGDDVVGYYIDSSSKMHGFVATYTGAAKRRGRRR
jgi:hypothetical protein